MMIIEKVFCRREWEEKGREEKRRSRQDSEDLRSQRKGLALGFPFVVCPARQLEIIRIPTRVGFAMFLCVLSSSRFL